MICAEKGMRERRRLSFPGETLESIVVFLSP